MRLETELPQKKERLVIFCKKICHGLTDGQVCRVVVNANMRGTIIEAAFIRDS